MKGELEAIFTGLRLKKAEYTAVKDNPSYHPGRCAKVSIDGVDGSFVLYDNNGEICISARSMGAINVQVIMETLGGGGHHTMAAAQLKGTEMEKAKQLLLEAIDKYYRDHQKS